MTQPPEHRLYELSRHNGFKDFQDWVVHRQLMAMQSCQKEQATTEQILKNVGKVEAYSMILKFFDSIEAQYKQEVHSP